MNELEELDDLARRAIAEYTSTLPPEDQIRRRGRRRRHRRTATGIMGAVTVLVLAVAGVSAASRLLPQGEGGTAIVAAVAPTTSAGGPGPSGATALRVGDVDPVLGARLVEVDGCPALKDVDWTVSVGPGPLSTAPVIAVSHGTPGSTLAKTYTARGTTPGWLTQDPHPAIQFDASGDVTITEATPGTDAHHPPGGLVPSELGCRGERWDRSSNTTDADIVVLAGKPALLYLLGARAEGSQLHAVTSPTGAGVTVWQLRRGADEALVVDRRPDDVMVIRTQAGTLPTGDLLARWLSRT